MTKELDRIPVGKVKRAIKLMNAGVKVGVNYMKAYSKATIKGKQPDTEELNRDNAEAIYGSLSELKGSTLKMAQLISMDQNILPKAYSDKFAMAQYSVPPLSYPLVKKTLKENLGKEPNELFEFFGKAAENAASMGQVHKAVFKGDKLAVKVQYPGVADSIRSDLRLAKPFAFKLMNVKGKDAEPYMKEIEGKLLEEADYELELKQSMVFVQKCEKLANVFFPKYYPELSASQILTMSWIEGEPIGAWMKREQPQEARNKLGQILWDFYMFQIHELRMIHADPHPGNFIINKSTKLGVIDFGCIKHIPDDFYKSYFELVNLSTLEESDQVDRLFRELEIIQPTDTKTEVAIVTKMFTDLIRTFSRPFHVGMFDFGDESYFSEIYFKGKQISKDPQMSRLQARGSRHFIYFNRTFFGLYNILHSLKAKVDCSVNDLVKKIS